MGARFRSVRCAGAAHDAGSDLPDDDNERRSERTSDLVQASPETPAGSGRLCREGIVVGRAGRHSIGPSNQGRAAIIAERLKPTIVADRCPPSPRVVRRLKAIPVGALFVVMLMAAPAPLPAQAPAECKLNQVITDVHGNHGVIFGGHDDLCLIKYKDGQIQQWVALKNLNMIAPTATPAAPRSAASVSEAVADGVKLLRPTDFNRLVYRADARGHVVLTATVNGAPIKFVVDTG